MVFASVSDGPAVARAVERAKEEHSRLSIAVPIYEPGAWTYLTPFPLERLREELEEEAEWRARMALQAVPRDLPVTVRTFRSSESKISR